MMIGPMIEMAVNAPYASATQPMVLRAVAVLSFIKLLLLCWFSALHHDGPRCRCCEAQWANVAVLRRVIPAFELLHVSKFENDEPPWLPIALYRLVGSSSHHECTAILIKRWLHLLAIVRVHLLICYLLNINHKVCCHDRFLSFSGSPP